MSIFNPGCNLVIVYTFCVLLLYGNDRQCSSSLDVLCKFSFLEDLELTCKAKDCTGFFNSLESQELLLDDTVVSHAMEQTLGRFL
jgi:hypothetical protein